MDVQLKVLQLLSSIGQNYANAINGDSQRSLLEVCSILQQVKTSAVRNSASAVFQQMITTLWEKIEIEDSESISGTISKTYGLHSKENRMSQAQAPL